MSNRSRRNKNANTEEKNMSEQPYEINADDVESAELEPVEGEGEATPAEEPAANDVEQSEQEPEEQSLKQVGERTDASGRSLFPWESLPKTK